MISRTANNSDVVVIISSLCFSYKFAVQLNREKRYFGCEHQLLDRGEPVRLTSAQLPNLRYAEVSVTETDGKREEIMNNMRLGEKERTLTEALTNGEQPQWWRTVTVSDVMATALLCVDSLTTVPEAQRLMQEHRIRRLPVIDDGKLVGIITQGDVRGALPSEATTLNRTEQAYLMNQVKVDRIMHTNVLTIHPTASLAAAARLMVQHKIGGLPVVDDNGAVIGVVTESDIFSTFVKIFDTLEALGHQTSQQHTPSPDNSD